MLDSFHIWFSSLFGLDETLFVLWKQNISLKSSKTLFEVSNEHLWVLSHLVLHIIDFFGKLFPVFSLHGFFPVLDSLFFSKFIAYNTMLLFRDDLGRKQSYITKISSRMISCNESYFSMLGIKQIFPVCPSFESIINYKCQHNISSMRFLGPIKNCFENCTSPCCILFYAVFVVPLSVGWFMWSYTVWGNINIMINSGLPEQLIVLKFFESSRMII